MPIQSLLPVLQEFGLSEKEAKVYLAMLSLGESTIQRIANVADVKRPTVYPILESLKQKGMVNTVVRGLKQTYKASSPEQLQLLFDQRRKRLASALPDLLALYNTEGQTQGFIKYFEGLEAVKSVYESNLRDIKAHENYCVIADQQKWIELDPKYFENFTYRRGKLPINIRLLLLDSPAARTFKKKEHYYNMEIRFLPPRTQLTTNLVIIPERLFMHQLTPPVNGIVIENISAICTQMELFEILWKKAGQETA
ncbi:MAG: helix-turn-helix domain-containing protein [Candidatus Peregrinibacteria bacterium]